MEPLTSGVGANKRYNIRFLTRLVHLNHFQRRATDTSVRKSELIQVGGTTKGRGRTCELSRRNKRGHTLIIESKTLDRAEWWKRIHMADPN